MIIKSGSVAYWKEFRSSSWLFIASHRHQATFRSMNITGILILLADFKYLNAIFLDFEDQNQDKSDGEADQPGMLGNFMAGSSTWFLGSMFNFNGTNDTEQDLALIGPEFKSNDTNELDHAGGAEASLNETSVAAQIEKASADAEQPIEILVGKEPTGSDILIATAPIVLDEKANEIPGAVRATPVNDHLVSGTEKHQLDFDPDNTNRDPAISARGANEKDQPRTRTNRETDNPVQNRSSLEVDASEYLSSSSSSEEQSSAGKGFKPNSSSSRSSSTGNSRAETASHTKKRTCGQSRTTNVTETAANGLIKPDLIAVPKAESFKISWVIAVLIGLMVAVPIPISWYFFVYRRQQQLKLW